MKKRRERKVKPWLGLATIVYGPFYAPFRDDEDEDPETELEEDEASEDFGHLPYTTRRVFEDDRKGRKSRKSFRRR